MARFATERTNQVACEQDVASAGITIHFDQNALGTIEIKFAALFSPIFNLEKGVSTPTGITVSPRFWNQLVNEFVARLRVFIK